MKRLVFCFDGTWNRVDAPHSTTVVITAESVLPMPLTPSPPASRSSHLVMANYAGHPRCRRPADREAAGGCKAGAVCRSGWRLNAAIDPVVCKQLAGTSPRRE